MVLADYADNQGSCFPSQETLAEDCHLTRKTVRTALQGLERSGIISRVRRWKKNGERSADGINLLIQTQRVIDTPRDDSLRVIISEPKGNGYPASILKQSLEPKGESKLVWKVKQDDGPLLNRFKDADVWKKCEKLMQQNVPKYMDNAHFPSETVRQAQEEKKNA